MRQLIMGILSFGLLVTGPLSYGEIGEIDLATITSLQEYTSFLREFRAEVRHFESISSQFGESALYGTSLLLLPQKLELNNQLWLQFRMRLESSIFERYPAHRQQIILLFAEVENHFIKIKAFEVSDYSFNYLRVQIDRLRDTIGKILSWLEQYYLMHLENSKVDFSTNRNVVSLRTYSPDDYQEQINKYIALIRAQQSTCDDEVLLAHKPFANYRLPPRIE